MSHKEVVLIGKTEEVRWSALNNSLYHISSDDSTGNAHTN